MTLEHDKLEGWAKRIMGELINKVPDEALPLLTTREMMRGFAWRMIENLETDDLVDLMLAAYLGLEEMFQDVAKDWMMKRLGRAGEFDKISEVLKKAQIAFS